MRRGAARRGLVAFGLLACSPGAGGGGSSGDMSSGTSEGATTTGTTTGAATTGTATTGGTTTGGATGAEVTTSSTGAAATTEAGSGSSAADTCDVVPSYLDVDGDGYGNDKTEELGCAVPRGRAPIGGDCDDSDPQVHPGQPETCGLGDDDCDGLVDEYDEFGNKQCGVCTYLIHEARLYAFCQGTRGWGPARQDCVARGLDLAIVAGAAEHAWIAAQPPIDSGLWYLGARDNVMEGSFQWVDMAAIDPADPRWAPGEPNNKGTNNAAADCLGLVAPGVAPGAGLWVDEDCTRNRAWICEGDLP